MAHERLGKPTALAVFASDALSSTAYASEEILRTLLFGAGAIGILAFSYLVPITVALVAVLVILIFSYRQTIKDRIAAGGDPQPEIMIPLVAAVTELDLVGVRSPRSPPSVEQERGQPYPTRSAR